MAFDTSRLKSTLLKSGLQIKDPPLYQVINQLIDALNSLTQSVASGGSGGTSTIINNNVTQFLSSLSGGIEDAEETLIIPGPKGDKGDKGDIGPPGFIWDDCCCEEIFFVLTP